MTELLAEFSPSAYLTDTHLSRLKRIPPQYTRSCGAQHARCRRRPLGHEGLVTLALRKLNHQPSGVHALSH
jgi:hypothetical protein